MSTKHIDGGANIATLLGLDKHTNAEAVPYQAPAVLKKNGGELYAAPRQLARWQSTDLADLQHEPCPQWYRHMQAVLAPLMAFDAKEAA